MTQVRSLALYPVELGEQLVEPGGFEPPSPSLRGWHPRPLDDGSELAPAPGFEPGSFSVNSRAHSPRVLDRNGGVTGYCPRLPLLARHRCSLLLTPEDGALSWFRATLSCSSGRRFHQISLQGLVRTRRIEPLPRRWQRRTHTSTPRPRFGAPSR